MGSDCASTAGDLTSVQACQGIRQPACSRVSSSPVKLRHVPGSMRSFNSHYTADSARPSRLKMLRDFQTLERREKLRVINLANRTIALVHRGSPGPLFMHFLLPLHSALRTTTSVTRVLSLTPPYLDPAVVCTTRERKPPRQRQVAARDILDFFIFFWDVSNPKRPCNDEIWHLKETPTLPCLEPQTFSIPTLARSSGPLGSPIALSNLASFV